MKNTLRPLALLFCLLLLVQFVCPEEKKPFWSRFSLKVTGGWGSDIPIGDVNDCLESFNNNEVFDYLREANSDRIAGEIKTLDGGISHWEAELRFDLTPRISLGIATSAPFHTHNESSVTYIIRGWAGEQIMTWTFTPEIKVSFPVRFSAYYTLPLVRRLNIAIGGGVGLYPSKIAQIRRYDAIYPLGDTGWSIGSQVAKRNFALGFHGNILLEYHLFKRLFFISEFQAIYSKISSFKGKWNATSSHGDTHLESGTLYYFTEWNVHIGARYATLEVWEKPPELSYRDIRDLREAALDLSGYSLRIGLRIKFF